MKGKQYQLNASAKQAIGSRERQEDALLVSGSEVFGEKGILAVLADGMGGMSDGDKFSAIATREMVGHFETAPYDEDMCATLRACYAAAQKKAIELQNPDEGTEGGSTVTAILIRDGKCAFLSAGDSRIYLLRGKGLIQLNREQVLGKVLDERAALGIISRDEAELNIKRKALINHLGREGSVDCDICSAPFDLLPGDRLALMSDGVFGTLDDKTLCRLLQLPVERASDAVIEAVLRAKKLRQDNCSILLISLEKPDA